MLNSEKETELSEQNTYKKSRRNKKNPTFELLWRVIASCLLIDFLIFCFFRFVMDVTVIDGIHILQNKVAVFFNPVNAAPPPVKRVLPQPVPVPSLPQASRATHDLDDKFPEIDVTGKIFTWIDEKGTYHSSNTTLPQDNDTVRIQTEINTYKKFTHVRIFNNKIVIPMTIYHKDQRSDFQILIDTGCTHTILPFGNMNGLDVIYGNRVLTTVANGEKLEGRRVTVDRIQIGSQVENNFTVTVGKVVTSGGQGLLGIDFLKNHPFRVDFRNQLIVWE